MKAAVRAATQGDLSSVRSLLTSVDLTVAGVGQHLEHFLVVEDAGEIVACAGLETYGGHALLRSVAVHPHYRKQGLARLLVTRLVDQARQDRLHAVYLLTTAAEAYFRRLGFDTIPREDVDPRVKQSAEFAEGVCATARAMVLPLQAIAEHPPSSKQTKPRGRGRLLHTSPEQSCRSSRNAGVERRKAMDYSIKGDGSHVNITVKGVGDKQADLMKELNECAEGHCSCPTPQYAKVQEMQIASTADQVVVTLTAKPGETINQADIDKCLDHATRKVQKRSSI